MGKTPQYPRSAPFQSPDEANGNARPPEARLAEALAREARLRRWMVMIAAGTVTVVMLTVAGGVYFVTRSLQRASAAVVPTGAAAKPEPEVKPPLREKMQPARPEHQPLMPRDPPVPREQPPTPRERSLEAVGGLSAAHLYQSYLNIGLLADAAENDVYNAADAKKLLTTILAWMDNIDTQLNRLAESGIDPDDQKKVVQVRRLAGLLRTQAKELQSYWEVPEGDAAVRKDHEMKFHQSREQAWAGIKELLGIVDE